jgi:hypothetical protein
LAISTVMLGGIGSKQHPAGVDEAQPVMGERRGLSRSTSPGASSLMPRTPAASDMAAKFGLLKLVQRAIGEHHDLDRHAELHEAQEIAHQHGEAAVARQGDHFAAGNAVSRERASGLEPQWRCECVNGRRPLCRRTARWEHVAAGEARRLFAGTD